MKQIENLNVSSLSLNTKHQQKCNPGKQKEMTKISHKLAQALKVIEQNLNVGQNVVLICDLKIDFCDSICTLMILYMISVFSLVYCDCCCDLPFEASFLSFLLKGAGSCRGNVMAPF